MTITEKQRRVAKDFLEVVPPLLHSLGSDLRDMEAASGPVTLQQFRTLASLHRHRCSLSQLAARHEVSAPAVSRLISTLVERGWVQREPDPDDRRQVILTLTDEGAGVWDAMMLRGTVHLAGLLAELSDEEREALQTALVGLRRVVAARRDV